MVSVLTIFTSPPPPLPPPPVMSTPHSSDDDDDSDSEAPKKKLNSCIIVWEVSPLSLALPPRAFHCAELCIIVLYMRQALEHL